MKFLFKEIVNTSNTSKDNKKHKQRVHGERDLELNHSHYLMLDDGTIRYYNTKDYRTGLAAHMGKLQDEHGFPSMYKYIFSSVALRLIYNHLNRNRLFIN